MICIKCKKNIEAAFLFCPYCGQNQKKALKKRKQIKRENGTGSVYKRNDLKSRPWVAAAPGIEGDKNYRQSVIGHFATAQEAKDALDAYRRAPTNKLNHTLEMVHKEWLPSWVSGKSYQLTDSYNAAWNKMESLWKTKFRDLRTSDFQKIIDFLQTEREKMDKHGKPVMKNGDPVMLQPMSYSSVHDVKVLAGLLYKHAMQNDICHKNYGEYLKLPPKPKGVKDCFTDVELKKIEQASTGPNAVPFADCILFMCYTGLRIAEFLSLKPDGVYINNGIYALYGGIKTDAGRERIVPIHHKILPILKKWMLKNGETVFCKPDGKPYSPDYFRRKIFYNALEEIGVRRLTPQATRRRMATSMSTAKVQSEDFIAVMGHTDFIVDIESYIKQTAEKLHPSIEKLI